MSDHTPSMDLAGVSRSLERLIRALANHGDRLAAIEAEQSSHAGGHDDIQLRLEALEAWVGRLDRHQAEQFHQLRNRPLCSHVAKSEAEEPPAHAEALGVVQKHRWELYSEKTPGSAPGQEEATAPQGSEPAAGSHNIGDAPQSSEQAGAGDGANSAPDSKATTVASPADLLLQLAYASDLAKKHRLIESDREAVRRDERASWGQTLLFSEGRREGRLEGLRWALRARPSMFGETLLDEIARIEAGGEVPGDV